MEKLKLEDLGLSERALICVKRFGITNVDELVDQMDTFTRHAPRISAEVKAALQGDGEIPPLYKQRIARNEAGKTDEPE